MKKPLMEVIKFAARMAIFALPVIIDQLGNIGATEWAALASAALALIDKYLHSDKEVPVNGLLPF